MDRSFRPRLLSVEKTEINTLSTTTMIDDNNCTSTSDEVFKIKYFTFKNDLIHLSRLGLQIKIE